MNTLSKMVARLISFPARLKGMQFGTNSFIGPGYDWLNVDLNGVVLGDNVVIGRNAWIQTLDKDNGTGGKSGRAPDTAQLQGFAASSGGRETFDRIWRTKYKIIIGNNTQIGRNVLLSAIKNIKIGKDCLLAYNVSIVDHDHNVENIKVSPIHSGLSKPRPVIIDDECFIGAHSFILKGVHLGKHCLVGANSVVTKSFSAYSVIAGNPAKLIRRLK